jgi:pyruvate kinase
VRKFRPRRDLRGRVVEPAVVRFVDTASAGGRADAAVAAAADVVAVLGDVIARARKGDTLRLVDARGKRRRLIVTARGAGSVTASSTETIYFEAGTPVALYRGDRVVVEAPLGPLPFVEEPLLLRQSDVLTLTREGAPKPDSTLDYQDLCIGCTLPEVFACARPGERIYFDDGKIAGRILRNDGERIAVRITQAAASGSRLASEKGINLPDTELRTPALTDKDRADLAFVASRVDIVGMSFVRNAEDMDELHRHLDALGAGAVGTVLKIENRQAFENLPRLLLHALTHPPVGVMVARGDLAVELGFERLAEVQEQILWLCEAAHVPVIWATQVLDIMARSGMPSRAEVTDAVMSGRAECVMLNKGPYMVEVLHLLKDILGRMSAHQSKKRALLRPLSISKLD